MDLDAIVARQRAALAEPFPAAHTADLERRAAAYQPLDFRAALLAAPAPALIAECKHRSPVRGPLVDRYDVPSRARAYAAGGAVALSILTNADFWGSLEHLAAARGAVAVPLLRKDFLLEESQLLEARAFGADCVLLIARILPGGRLGRLAAAARAVGLQVMVEVHAADEVGRALEVGPDLLGVNHRDLATFEVDPGLFAAVAPLLPAEVPMVAESGLRTRAEVLAAGEAGASAVLVGETLMRAEDPAAMAAELAGRAG
ncbi:MAG: indole-3-glycerol phosphate synthase TrpC [Candidatus Dormibacteria bacterium]